jgi:pheromone receptor transcription factor
MDMESKKSKGRQKIEMKRIEDLDDLLITFSKRRSGIYKKASELATLCGAEVGVVVFSPSGKPFSFGHPSIDSVAYRFLSKDPVPQGDTTHPLVEAHRRVRINQLNQRYCELVRLVEAERERGKALQKVTKARGSKGWWEAPLEKLSFQELQQLSASLEELHHNLCNRMKEKLAAGASSSSSFLAGSTHPSAFPPSYYGYGGKQYF